MGGKNNRWIKQICVLIVMIIVGIGCRKINLQSQYINGDVSLLLSDKSTHMFYSTGEFNDERLIHRFGLFGGSKKMGELVIEDFSDIDINVLPRFGEIKVLIVNKEKNNDIVFNKKIEKQGERIRLDTGEYMIYFIGNWFSGECQMFFENCTFNLGK